MSIYLLLQSNDSISWIAPYAYGVVILGFSFFLFRVFESLYSNTYDKPLFRHYLVYRKINKEQLQVLESEFDFYNRLPKAYKKQFLHRVATFINDKKFIGRDELKITERIKVLIAATGCMLSFGRKNYTYTLIEHILVYPNSFYSAANEAYHDGEFNPGGRALVLSWKAFEKGITIDNDNYNLGIHEFMHAMQLEAKQSSDIDSSRFKKQFQNILQTLTNQEVKDKLDETRYFRAYAFTNQYEFMAVLAEYFIESPNDFKLHFPVLYMHTLKLFSFNFSKY